MAATSSRRKPVPLTANRILVIDDDPLITKILERGLEQHGYTVAVARHGKDASFLVLEFKPDLVILDIMLPDIDGEEICKRIRAHPEAKNVRIISISAVGDPAKVQAMRNAGIDFFIPKPFSIQDVVHKIQELIGQIRVADVKPPPLSRYKLIAAASAICLVLAVGAIVLINNLFLEDVPPQMETLAEFAQVFSKADANSDRIVTLVELPDAEQFSALDRDKDGLITPADGREEYMALSNGEAYSRDRWIDLGGDGLAFEFLDLDENGALDERDFMRSSRTDQSGGAQDIITLKDPRTGKELALDPLRRSWLEAILDTEPRGYTIWRGSKVIRNQLASSTWGRITASDGKVLAEGFVREVSESKEWTVIDARGESITIPVDENVFTALPEAPPTQWHSDFFALKPDNAAGWANLAQVLARHPDMTMESRDAAKRALIYDHTLEYIYKILNVELQKGRLVEKAKAGQ